MPERLWPRVAESQVPGVGDCSAWAALGVGIEFISSCKEGASWDPLWQILEDELVVQILQVRKDGVISRATETVLPWACVPPVAPTLELPERDDAAREVFAESDVV